MKNKFFVSVLFLLVLVLSCNPYKGFEGVNRKGMKKNKPPSVGLKEDHENAEKKMLRKYRREMKKRAKEKGSKQKK